MISLLLPTRKRPESLARFVNSALDNATTDIEIVCYVDDDDDSYDNLGLPITIVKGQKIIMSDMWNRCVLKSSGDILGMMCDETVFRTKDWDKKIIEVFDKYPDKIVFAHGSDGSPVNTVTASGEPFGTLGFVHRKWFDTIGYVMAPYFAADMCDAWLNDVADSIDRHVLIPDLLTEHMHYAFGKGKLDKTHAERLERAQVAKPGELYYTEEMKQKRKEDAQKLRKVIDEA